jgi:hypothetical protein
MLRDHWHITISMIGDYGANEQPDGALRIRTMDTIKPHYIVYEQCPDLENCEVSRSPKAYQKRS